MYSYGNNFWPVKTLAELMGVCTLGGKDRSGEADDEPYKTDRNVWDTLYITPLKDGVWYQQVFGTGTLKVNHRSDV